MENDLDYNRIGREKTQPDQREPDPHSQRTERDYRESGREKTQPDQREPDPHHQRTGRDSERAEGVIWMNWREELVVRVGFGD